MASPAFQTGSARPCVSRGGRALSPHARATPPDSARGPLQKGGGSETPPFSVHPFSVHSAASLSASFSNVHNPVLAEPCLTALFWPHYLSSLMGKKDWLFANFLPSHLTKRNTAFSCSAASPSSLPLPNPKEFFWGDLGDRESRGHRRTETERQKTKANNLGQKKLSWSNFKSNLTKK